MTGMLAISAPLPQGHAPTSPRAGTPGNPIRVAAGGRLTATFVLGSAAAPVATTPRVLLPIGWAAAADPVLLPPGPLARGAWQSQVVTPSSAHAGRYVVRAVTESGADSVYVDVEPRRSLELVALEPPTWTLPGGAYRGRLIVRNNGNTEATVVLAVEAAQGETRVVDPGEVTLAPGACRLVTVSGAVSPSASGPDTVRVTAYDRDAQGIRAMTSLRVTVVGRSR